MLTADVRILFCNAAGPRIGFGHVARSRALARVLRVPHLVALRGTAATRAAVRAMGATTLPASARSLDDARPDLVVIDDPCQAAAKAWLTSARARGMLVASVQDLGIGMAAADLVIDGSIGSERFGASIDLAGPRFAILDPRVRQRRARPPVRVADRVLIALGGGAHVFRFGAALAFGICRAVPGAEIVLAAGFARGRRPDLPAGGRWIQVTGGLSSELCRSAVAVIGGGVTLYEACALGTPAVAIAVAPSQRLTIRGLASRGAVADAGSVTSARAVQRVASNVKRLIAGGPRVALMTDQARVLVDGEGAFRVARVLAALVARAKEHRHAA